jgi:two-component system, OmpR family, phosphate regulon sensor histidine kinase PhoR
MNSYELPVSREEYGLGQAYDSEEMADAVLLSNAYWFTKIRWLVISSFVITGLASSLAPQLFVSAGLLPPGLWPWIFAGDLFLANIIFLLLLRHLNEQSPHGHILGHIWLQITVDLIILSMLVHLVGSTDTFIAFTYLFHIALACIFFPRRQSLLVTVLAAGLYLTCLSLELSGYLPESGIVARVPGAPLPESGMKLLAGMSGIGIWFVVWYLVSALSTDLRRRDRLLNQANKQLMLADREKTRVMLCTTHDLKAPFAGIEMNIQELRYGHWSNLPEGARRLISRIEERSCALRERVNDIILLGNLKSGLAEEPEFNSVDLKTTLDAALLNVSDKAQARNISLSFDVPSVPVPDRQNRLVILFTNLLVNAVNYSHEGSRVEVWTEVDKDSVHLFVKDYGIGIEKEELPRIFGEYYRTKRAAEFNKHSTGLGLSIAKEIARSLGLRLKVSSEPNLGSTVEVILRTDAT